MPVNGSVCPEAPVELPVAAVAVGASVPPPAVDDVAGVAAVVLGAAWAVLGGAVTAVVGVACEVVGEFDAVWLELVVLPNGSVYCWLPAEPPPWASAAVGPARSASRPKQMSSFCHRIARVS
jgi:hypothetical protein